MKRIILSLLTVVFTSVSFAKNLEENQVKDENGNSVYRIDNSNVSVKVPKYIFSGLNTNIDIIFTDPTNEKLVANNNDLFFIINGVDTKIHFDKNGIGTFHHSFSSNEDLTIYFEDFAYKSNIHVIPIWYVVTPVALLVLFLGFKLIRSGRKGKGTIEKQNIDKVATNVKPVNSLANETKNESKIVIKEVKEKEEEIFA